MFHHRSFTSAGPQDSLPLGVFSVMGDESGDDGPNLAVYESVSCLECGTVYAKPAHGGTARSNPGCPECGYVGWVAVNARVGEAQPHRSDVDPQLGRSAQSH
jgi:hypothetical protein